MKKAFIIIISIVIILCAGGYFSYQYFAPKVFDYVVEKNIDSFKKMIDDPEAIAAKLDIAPKETKSPENNATPLPTPTQKKNNTKNPTNSSAPPAKGIKEEPKKEEPAVKGVKTSIGEFSNEELLKVLKEISPQDKTRIISICQNGIPKSEIPKLIGMVNNGLTGEDQKYLENYLRASLSIPSKTEILNIILKYTKGS